MKKITIVFWCILLFYACKNFSSRRLSDTEKEELRFNFKNNLDSVKFFWNAMVKSNFSELDDLKHLIDLIAITEDHDTLGFQRAKEQLETFKKINYTMNFISHSDSIDYYDNQMTVLIKTVFDVVQNSPKIGVYPLYFELIDNIKRADDEILFHRLRYDDAVGNYHKFIDTNKALLSQLGDEYENPERFPVFTLHK